MRRKTPIFLKYSKVKKLKKIAIHALLHYVKMVTYGKQPKIK